MNMDVVEKGGRHIVGQPIAGKAYQVFVSCSSCSKIERIVVRDCQRGIVVAQGVTQSEKAGEWSIENVKMPAKGQVSENIVRL